MNWTAFWVSISAAAMATLIVTVLGIALGYVVAKFRFPGRGALQVVALLPVALPPTVVGYYLLTTLGGPGIVRDLSTALFGHPLTFTFTGVVIAQSIESFPYCFRAATVALGGVDGRLEDVARVAGMPGWRVLFMTTLPLAAGGITAGVAMAFGRALGDFGATVAISGHLPTTTTMPIALFDALFDGSAGEARTLALVQISMTVLILLGISRSGQTREWLLGRMETRRDAVRLH